MIVVTGSNGFIGSNLIKGLNEIGYKNIIAVDDQDDPELKENIAHCDVQDFLNIDEFINLMGIMRLMGQELGLFFIKELALIQWNGMLIFYTTITCYILKSS